MFEKHSTPLACRVAEFVIEELYEENLRLKDEVTLLQAQCDVWALYVQVAQDQLRDKELKRRRKTKS